MTLVLLIMVPLISMGYSIIYLKVVSLQKSLRTPQIFTKEEEKKIFSSFKDRFTHRFKGVELNSPYT